MHRLHDHNIKNRLENLCGTLTGFIIYALITDTEYG